MGRGHDVFRVCAQFCRFRCGALSAWGDGGWFASRHGKSPCLFPVLDGKLTEKVLYLSSFYRRSHLALRIGLFYTAASLSGAFGGRRIGPSSNGLS